VAWTLMVCVPFVSELVLMLVVQLVVPVATWGAPLSTLTCTCAMPALSVAVPATVTVPETVLPLAGCVMLTDGDGGAFPKTGKVLAVQAFARQGSPSPCSIVASVE